MDIEEKKQRLDARWDEINPTHAALIQKQRAALPSLLEDDELPERIVVGTPLVVRTTSYQHSGGFFKSVLVVATDRQVLYVTDKDALRLAYADIESVSVEKEGVIKIVGGNWVINFFSHATQQETERFVGYVKGEAQVPLEEQPTAYLKGEDAPRGEPTRVALLTTQRLVDPAFIDQQWNAVKPWRGNDHTGERRMLYDLLEEGENIERLVGGTYRAEQDTFRSGKHRGAAVATSKRVLFVDKGVFGSTEVSEMPYRNIEAITYSTGLMMAGVQITGRGVASFRIEDIAEKDSVKPFVDCVRGHLESAHAPQAAAPPAPSFFAANEIEKLASLLERGFLTQEEFDAKKRQLLGL